jgi:hypothetical protein
MFLNCGVVGRRRRRRRRRVNPMFWVVCLRLRVTKDLERKRRHWGSIVV